MKRFKDLTELEINVLTEEELRHYIEIECAEEGVAFIQEPIKPEYKPDVEPDIILYGIDGYPSVYVRFEKEEDAKKMCDLLNTLSVHGRTELYGVKPKRSLSDEAEEKQRAINEENGEKKRRYDDALAAYSLFRESWDRISEPIYVKHREVTEKYVHLDRMKSLYKGKYLELAGGDKEIAKRFLRNAYIIAEESEEYVFGDALQP